MSNSSIDLQRENESTGRSHFLDRNKPVPPPRQVCFGEFVNMMCKKKPQHSRLLWITPHFISIVTASPAPTIHTLGQHHLNLAFSIKH